MASATAPTLPDSASTVLPEGQAVTVPVTITNEGPEPEDFFFDARLNSYATVKLPSLTGDSFKLPATNKTGEPEWIVPTETSSILIAQSSTVPAMFDYGAWVGDPDLASVSTIPGQMCSNAEQAFVAPRGGSVTVGGWYALPSECGPYATAAPSGSATVTATVTTMPIDESVNSPYVDFWATTIDGTFTFDGVTIAPGKSVTVPVTITPSAAKGTVVKGTLYVDDALANVPPYGQATGNEVDALPYEYTVG